MRPAQHDNARSGDQEEVAAAAAAEDSEKLTWKILAGWLVGTVTSAAL
jgi:hypothetical protein